MPDVVIAGGGSVGLATAVFLAHHGVRAHVVERRAGLSEHPRALGISPRTLEFFRETGLGESLEAVAVRSTAMWKANARTVAEIDRDRAPRRPPLVVPEVSPEMPRGHYPQDRLDAVLLPAARERGATVEFGVAVTGVEQDPDGVSVALSDGRVLRTRYLVGADGVNTAVRPALGIGTTGPGEVGDPVLNILFEADLDARFGLMPAMTEIRHPDVRGMLMSVGERRWVLHTGAPGTPEELVRTAIGADVPVTVIAAKWWRATLRMAEEFRAGRAFLVGDAARAITPLGAFGLNTGLADAHNLAWKLAMVLAGRAGERLLDTYHDERHAVAELVTRQAVLRWRNPRLHWDPSAVAERAAVGAWHAPVVAMGYRYDSAAVIDAVVDMPSTEDVLLSLDGAAGSRLPHRWVSAAVSTLDLVRSRFTVFAAEADWAEVDWADAADKAGARLGLTVGTALVADPGWPAQVGLSAGGALLVRPDGFVAWRSPVPVPEPDAVLESVLARVTGLR
ncbi:FAD-dependent monooxygenase [Amycolatopsis thermophila]|uniref:2-polyprenyl-6-methoxyphenol hydroxylase-like FAD-dependent oxidoreductase n=1 Tax=Amycolatopsis thermophila TaxID=206084 RepID=A0ABU0F0J0_9PSEU|nr:FAD-dependent monooxygenase [Amycolatopsis thermophila]MDQ0380635.1 2-polyprenyl-6-methoxyphenol hydroxylase-like FAD-dependent oxidoreductase [Amycolatopsis thermophila]